MSTPLHALPADRECAFTLTIRHRWDVDHHHAPLGDPQLRPYGNGVVLWFELDDFDDAVSRARAMNGQTLKAPRRSENGNWEYWLRDPTGYTVVLTSPLP
jgi:hypothetical protein